MKKIVRLSDTELNGYVKEIRQVIDGKGDYNKSERIDVLLDWMDRANKFANGLIEKVDANGGSNNPEDHEWPIRLSDLLSEASRAIAVYSADNPPDSQVMYPSAVIAGRDE